ncbi:acyl-CoA thioesterase [Amphibacillus sediminis]|uniref:acyl-CoA thioesterase n=1 Tax=Amphibacillus sediminis TaxID=360185 RepID=UPI00082CE73B|nr:thioesterase family protein [Amphibacillus sediminis]
MEPIITPIQVRYQETDQMGVVYHANYLVWFEIGRTALIEHLGLSYAEMEQAGVVSPVTHVEIDYLKPIRYGQPAYVKTWLEHYDGLRTSYRYQVIDQEEQVAVSGRTDHVVVDRERFKPLSIRRKFPEWHQRYQQLLKGE